MTEPDALFDLAVAHQRAGRLAQAEAACRTIIDHHPHHARALHLFGVILYGRGDVRGGTNLVRQATGYNPDYAEAHFNLGAMLAAQDQPEQAATHYAAAARIKPDDIVAHVRHAAMLDTAGRFDESIKQYELVISRWPDCLPALLDLASLYLRRGRTSQAIVVSQRAVDKAPDNADAALRLGRSLKQSGDLEGAIAKYRRSLALQPDHFDALNFLAVSLYEQGSLDEASACISQALTLQPDAASAHFNAGLIAQASGDMTKARMSLHRALELAPEDPLYRRASLAALLYDPQLSLADKTVRRRDFGDWVTSRASPSASTGGISEFHRPLRIGWLSSDFRDHPVARNIEPLLTRLDRTEFQTYLYSHVAAPDEVTRRLQGLADVSHSTIGMSDAELVQRVRSDRIDILIVLAGHFDRNRPEVAAWRAAPVQISFHDPATSGIPAMNYLIADRRLVPRGGEEWFAERVLTLPTFYLHLPFARSPDVVAPPVTRTGAVTFGSFNNPAKINDEVLELWGRVLQVVPRSRLVLKYRRCFAQHAIQQRIVQLAARQGIDPARFIMIGEPEGHGTHLARYNGIDIALDPFPFSGSTTTFEALWMGVPVVTLPGASMVSRWSAAMLGALKRDEWVADSAEGYVRVAASLAADPARLSAIRAELRQRVTESPLCDALGRTRQFQRLLKAVWRKHCLETLTPASALHR